MLRTRLYADATGVFLHDAILAACQKFSPRTAIVDTSLPEPARLSYGEYGERVELAARGLVRAGIRPGEVIAIFLRNSWEYAVAYHAATLSGAIPTLLNPSYREREVRYQLEAADAVALITDAPLISAINLGGLPTLRRIITMRTHASGSTPFNELLQNSSTQTAALPKPENSSAETLAALPFSSGTTGLPKGVMLSHFNLLVNAYQTIRPYEIAGFRADDIFLCFLPLYHIYGLNVLLNPVLLSGGEIVMMPRFDAQRACQLIARERITYLMLVPPAMAALSDAAEGKLSISPAATQTDASPGAQIFPRDHAVRAVKCGAAPLGKPVAERFTQLTGIRIHQGYGMTEASPVTHLGYLEPELYRPDSIGQPAIQTECRIVNERGDIGEAKTDVSDATSGEPGELVMRGPQFMRGYWKSEQATAEVLRDGWYYSGDVVSRDREGFYFIVDRRKEMIKYKGFAIAPAEIEAVLLEHPAVRDCGVVGKSEAAAGELPVAFVVPRVAHAGCAGSRLATELCGYVAERLSHYKQPREVRFVEAIPRNPSGKILRRELRGLL